VVVLFWYVDWAVFKVAGVIHVGLILIAWHCCAASGDRLQVRYAEYSPILH